MLLDFVFEHRVDIFIITVILISFRIPFIPSKFAGLTGLKGKGKLKRLSIYDVITHVVGVNIATDPHVVVEFKRAILLIALILLGVDLYFDGRLSEDLLLFFIVGIIIFNLEIYLDTFNKFYKKVFGGSRKG